MSLECLHKLEFYFLFQSKIQFTFFFLVFDHVNMLISSAFHIGRFNLKPFLCFYFLMKNFSKLFFKKGLVN